MKKIVLSVLMLAGLTFTAQGQMISKNALGLRLGDNDGFGGEISYQRGLSDNNRLELDLGFRSGGDRDGGYDAYKLTGLYQWVWNIEGGFNWYAGVGGGLGTWSYDYNLGNDKYEDNGTILFAAGDIGIEYKFDIPLQVALDLRPELYFNSDDYRNDSFGPDIALSIRYTF
jgi:hypothetical protein